MPGNDFSEKAKITSPDKTLHRASEELNRRLSAIADKLDNGIQPSADDVDELERLSKLKTFLSVHRAQRRKQVELAVLCVATVVFLGLSFVRLSSTAVDLEIHATKVFLKLDEHHSPTLIPGEMGQILALKQARGSGADDVLPPEVAESGSFEIREVVAAEKSSDNRGSADLTVRLQEISIPEGPVSIAVGIAYASDSRGLTIETAGSKPVTAQFGQVIAVDQGTSKSQSVEYAIRPVQATGNNLALEIFPANDQPQLTVFRGVQVTEISFEDEGHSTILGGTAYIKGGAGESKQLQPGDYLTIGSVSPMLLRELVFANGELMVRLSTDNANTLQAGADSSSNLIPTLFTFILNRWPTQLYATLSALVATWFALRRWLESTQ